MSDTCCARRAFLRSTAAGAVGLTGLSLAACGGGTEDSESAGEAVHPGDTWESVLAAEELPPGASTSASVGEHDLLLHRSGEEEVHAFTSVCTHQGCTVEAEDERFPCPCHGSVFAVDSGEPISGPATRPLTRFEAEITDGEIRVLI
ncbi:MULTISPECIES: Rieske (2Fe-2S) protein [Nesterenkonia]|uniref:Cytochrome bc1 complex Rieske iron-sulfur subunit n=1 Tax=Nesterenkonia xinjiangensis TaxID=225327 RepID=A0A7Z0GP94_9MICC|nr:MULTISPECIES: Rieske (2Fe-2S) protein [Nesterenkonia]MDZ5078383.1 Rieske 2Fe-2S domain-containing protein [Nesterenkonia sp. HG001]NYJ79631.1 Rieske Fe-S protein [Nesterenkonia xinjiangensis]